jgi:hypothetical protein
MTRAAAVLAAIALAIASTASAHEVTLHLLPYGAHDGAEVAVELRRVGGLDATRVADGETITRTAKLGSKVELDLATGHWSLEVRGDGWWHPRQYVTVAGPLTADVRLWRSAQVTAAVSVKDGKPPVATNVRFVAPASELDAPPATEIECPVAGGRIVRCSIPAGRFDLRVRAKGFIGRSFTGKQLAAGTQHDLGAIVLVRGASISGKVDVAGAPKSDLRRVRVQALPARMEVWGPKPRELANLTAIVDERGTFQFDGIAPGEYELTAQLGRTHASPTIHVTVRDGAETELIRTMLLVERRPLAISIAPMVAPGGRPWQVRLDIYRNEHEVDAVSESAARVDGSWISPPLAPARYELSIRNGPGPSVFSRTLAIEEDPEPLFIDLVARGVKGTITLGEKPLEATLTFLRNELSATATSNKDGEFTIELPGKETEWVVDVKSDVPEIVRRLRRVVVEDDAVHIALPTAMILGESVSERGEPAPFAIINISNLDDPELTQGSSAEDGHFAVGGLAPGRYQIWAAGREGRSTPAEIDVAETLDPPSIRLVMKPVTRLFGDVFSAAGPVAGAHVDAESVDQPITFSATAVTAADGTFDTMLTPGTQEANIAVGPPGFAFKLFAVPVRKQQLRIPVSQEGGTLVVAGVAPDTHALWLAHNGAEIHLSILNGRWRVHRAEENGVVMQTIPMIEPGPYTVCALLAGEVAPFRRANAMPASRCASGYLAPFGTLTLTVPKIDAR